MSQRPRFSKLLWKLLFRRLPVLFLLFMGLPGSAFGQIDFTLNTYVSAGTCGNTNDTLKIVIKGAAGPCLLTVSSVSGYFNSTLQMIPASPDTLMVVLTNLPLGDYNVSVSDGTGTVVKLPTIYSIPGPSNANLEEMTKASCLNNDGVADITVVGGTIPYTFLYNGAVVGTSVGSTQEGQATGLPMGTLPITIKDGNGCTLASTVVIDTTDALTLLMDNDATICEGTSKQVVINSNATSFTWSPAAGLSSATVKDPILSPTTTTAYSLLAKLGICEVTGALNVVVLPAPVASAQGPDTTCYEKDIYLSGSGGGDYMWTPTTYLNNPTIANPLVINPKSSVTYSLTVTDANGCKSLKPATVALYVKPPYQVFAGNDTSVMVGQSVALNAVDVDGVGFDQWTWSPGVFLSSASIANPTASFSEVGVYTYVVDAKAPDGCGGSDSITIKVFSVADIFVPNAFTPNGDGHNDVLRAIPVSMREFRYLTIFNRWGQRVFTTTNVGIGWDGSFNGGPAPTGVYVWMVAGVDYTGRVVEKKGTVMLIR